MYSVTRNRETIYADYIFKYHPDFKDKVEKFYDRFWSPYRRWRYIKLDWKCLAIGISQRTQADAIEHIAKKIFFNSGNKEIETILAFNIPHNRQWCT